MITIDPPSPSFLPSHKSALTRFLNRARALLGLSGEVQILLTSDAAIKRLNKQFRNKNKPTDILSFPTPPEIAAQNAGDLAISLDTAARQAAEHNHPLQTELKVLILHGLLHLAGEDHETDSGQMAARELALRKKLKLRSALIERVQTERAR
jgi:probable rRNA maturation factor